MCIFHTLLGFALSLSLSLSLALSHAKHIPNTTGTTTTRNPTATGPTTLPVPRVCPWPMVDVVWNRECDQGAGEVYLKNSPGQVSSLQQCKKSCEDAAACSSITYYNSGLCNHFSTWCANTKRNTNTVALPCRPSSTYDHTTYYSIIDQYSQRTHVFVTRFGRLLSASIT